MLQEPSLHPGAVAVSGMRQQNTENIQHTPERIVEINRRQSPSVEEERPWPEDHAFVSSQSYGKEQEDSGDERQNQIDRSSYLIEAELVSPPIQAVSVMIDEEQPHNPHLEQRLGSSMQGSDRKERPDPASDETTRQLKRWIYGLVTIVAILFVIVLASVVVAIVTKSRDPNDSVAPTDDTAATFDYHCYRSTRDLLLAQIDDFVESRKTKDLYIICPGSYIKIGFFANPAINDYSITGGDQPLTAIMNDTTIQCGLDGRQENSCVLDGGLVQVIMQTNIPGIALDDRIIEAFGGKESSDLTVHNVTLRGFTFTGITKDAGSLSGLSLLLSQPGNVTVEDCRWTNMTSVFSIVAVGQNDYQASESGGYEEIPTHSSMLTIRNSQFVKIVYDHPIFFTRNQIVIVQNCTFSDISVSVMPDLTCEDWGLGGCANVMTCLGNAACFLSDSCFHNVETSGARLILYEKRENSLAFVPQYPLTPESAAFLDLTKNETGDNSFQMALSKYNNFLDKESSIDCEVTVLGFRLETYRGNESLESMECYDDLSFEAKQCLLES